MITDLTKLERITVITLDDHHLIRAGIRSLLAESEEITLVGEGWVGEHLDYLIEAHSPHVVLLDLEMPAHETTTGAKSIPFRTYAAIARLSKAHPQTRFIIISQHISPAILEGAVQSGVHGYLLKDDALSLHLIEAIRSVYRGGFYFSGEASQYLTKMGQMASDTLLTERQEEIIQVIASHPNWSYAQHAQQLGISEYTFSNHLRHIFEKLGAKNVTAAVVKAIQKGIILVSPQTGL